LGVKPKSTFLGKGEAMDGIGGAESIIDIDYGDSWGAGVEHTQKGG
jgi:hypothetical protein